MVPSPSQDFSWPSVVATKNGLIKEKLHLLALPGSKTIYTDGCCECLRRAGLFQASFWPLLSIYSIPWPRFDVTIEIPTLPFQFP
jgi:hypothetical protein